MHPTKGNHNPPDSSTYKVIPVISKPGTVMVKARTITIYCVHLWSFMEVEP